MTFLRTLTLNSLFLALMLWAAPAWAADPDLIDVLEITNTNNPIIVHENILPGDSFTDIMTVKNLTPDVAYDIAMNLDIDTSKGIWNFPNFKLEQEIMVKIKRDDGTFVVLPNGSTESTLHDLDETTIALGSLAGGDTEIFTILAYFDINAGNEYQNTKVYFNLDIGVDILGESPRLLLTKSNDSVSDETPGNEVVYSLTVTALGGDVNDVTLTDLPPEGFEYVDGSGEGAPFIHEYASPGVWDLGDMEEGESKTVTYKTKISGSQDEGLYKDLAFARGTSGTGTTVFANGEANPFVGTEVNVVVNSDPTVTLDEDTKEEKERKTKTITRMVLGATLPLTGTKAGWFGLAALLIGGGLGLVLSARRRKYLLKSLVVLAGCTVFGMPALAEAAALSVEIETPEAVMTTENFKIGFATLDVMGRDLEVQCFVVGNASPFATYALDSSFGGNAGDCEVNSLVVPTDGSYEFFVRVNAAGESPETVESEHVMVTVATDRPGTPMNYDRDENDCQVTLSFTTANDGGKTVKVELYRSEDNPFVANSSTKVNEQVIGSNTNGSFTESLPGCDDDVFYAIRAVAGNGNGSDFVGDVDVDTETTTSTRTRVNTVVVPATGGSALPVGATEGTAGSVQGVSTETTETSSEEGEGAGEGSEVLGEMTEEKETTNDQEIMQTLKDHPWLTALGLIALFLFVRYGYRRYATRTKQEL